MLCSIDYIFRWFVLYTGDFDFAIDQIILQGFFFRLLQILYEFIL